ncbi:MAG: extracellular solute-binding protein [Lachnospiraceae bacterium]|nr:extracellular solute-binding protein [Lachnospiraceae bacterium]
MNRWKRRGIILLLMLLLGTANGCMADRSGEKEEAITIYLHEAELLEDYAPYIKAQLPELNLEFYVGRNVISFYEFKQQHGDLPDIMMVGQLSARDSLELNPYLLDMSETETAASYYTTYLENYRCDDGGIRWLPSGGVFHGILANKDLFDQYQIPLPTDYSSFVAACKQFETHGIRGFVTDYKYDYTCLYTLEGWSINELMSREGSLWRLDYEAGLTNQLDRKLWLSAFQRMEALFQDVGMLPEDVNRGYTMTKEDFGQRKVAMIRGTAGDMPGYEEFGNIVLLPYFGKAPEENWLFTTPSFHVALNGQLADNEKKQSQVLKVLEVMLSAEGIQTLAESSQYLLAYHQEAYQQEASLELPEKLENLADFISSNRIYIGHSSTGLRAAATEAVQKLLTGELDAEGAYEWMNRIVAGWEKQKETTVADLERGYPSGFHPEKGNESASSLANTMRRIAGTDLLLAPASITTGTLYEGSYTKQQLEQAFQASGNRLYTGEITGAQFRNLVSLAVEGYGELNDPFSKETLPIVSGCEITVVSSTEGYRLKDITVGDKPIEDTAVYRLAIPDNPTRVQPLVEQVLGEGSFAQLTSSGEIWASALWVDYILAGNQPEPATPYLILE